MKELLSKGFWQDVKKTFHEALAGPRLEDNATPAGAEGQPKASLGAGASSSPQRSADAVTRSAVQ
jgi:hypothetical protein